MEFKTSDNCHKPIKSHWLGNAARSVQKVKYGCKNCEKDEYGLCWLYFQNFHPFSPFQLINYCQTQLKLPTNCKTLKFTQQNQQGFPGIRSRNSSRNLLAQNILLKSDRWAHSQHISHPRASSPPPPQEMQNLMHMLHIVFFFI